MYNSMVVFQLKLIILIFWAKFVQKRYFQSKSKFTIEFGRFESKFQLKLTILTFRTKFAQKRYSQSKTKKVNTNIELCIFESV